jgi:hypothetical protein
MGIFDFLNRSKISQLESEVKELNEVVKGFNQYGRGTAAYINPKNPFLHKFQGCQDKYMGQEDKRDPRNYIALSRAMIEAFPPIRAAIRKHIFMLGHYEYFSEDQVLMNEANDWAASVQIKGELVSPLDIRSGLFTLKADMMMNACIDGMYFDECLREDEEKSVGGIVGVKVFDSDAFDFHHYGDAIDRLIYTSILGMMQEVSENGIFGMFSNDWVPGRNWGRMMMYQADFVAEKVLSNILSKSSYDRRIGNPPTMNLFSAPAEEFQKLGPVQFEKYGNSLRDNFLGMLKGTKNNAEPSDIFNIMPVGGKLESTAFGAGVSGNLEFNETFLTHFKLMMAPTMFPVNYWGFETGAKGIGGRKDEIEMEQIEAYAKDNRTLIDKKFLNKARMHFLGLGTNPRTLERLEGRWTPPDTRNKKEEWEGEKVRVEAIEVGFRAYGEMLANLTDKSVTDAYFQELTEMIQKK